MSSETLNVILASVVVPVLAAIVPFVCAFLNRKKDEIEADIKDKNLKKYVAIAEDAIETAVVSISQTLVDAIKGTPTWTEEAQQQVFQQAKEQAILIMGSAARTAICEAYGDFDAWLDNSIQYYVKKNKAPALQPTIAATAAN